MAGRGLELAWEAFAHREHHTRHQNLTSWTKHYIKETYKVNTENTNTHTQIRK